MTKMRTHSYRPFRTVFFLVAVSLLLSENVMAQTKKKVDILHCDDLNYDARIVANAQRLLGHVKIAVDGAFMWCDSLYSYTDKNTVDAFGNVHIVRGDTLNMYGDYINYNGDTKMAKARRHVRLIDQTATLTTDSLDYDMNTDIAFYNNWGTVKDSTNVLVSKIGLYFVNEKKANFREHVDAQTKDYKIKSDTLTYFTDTKKVYLQGPTYIFNEKDTLYAEYGWYDSLKSYTRLTRKPKIWNIEQKIKADSIFYSKPTGEGKAMGHAKIEDLKNKIIVLGNTVDYNDLTKMASATDSAVFIQYSDVDSLYLHADVLRSLPDTAKQKPAETGKLKRPELKGELSHQPESMKSDTLVALTLPPDTLRRPALLPDSLKQGVAPPDTTKQNPEKEPRLVLAYRHVRFFRKDFQGKCDSLVYYSRDSTIQLYFDPLIWSDKNQISANYIEMLNKSKERGEILMKEDAFIIAMEDDSLRFNQIKGRNMTGYTYKNNLYKIDVDGNGQSNYYASDKNGIIGLNKAESSRITIYMDKGKVRRIAFIQSPDGSLKPLAQLQEGDKLLPGFKWQPDLRPKNKDDIFRITEPEKPGLIKPKANANAPAPTPASARDQRLNAE
jgi:hypothetical protein